MTYREIIDLLQREKERKRVKADKKLVEAYDYAISAVSSIAEMSAHLSNVLDKNPEYGLPESDFLAWLSNKP